jgi:geranylgeranyl diphosphate synthase, type II
MLNYKIKMKKVNESIEKFIYNPIKESNPVLYDIVKHALSGGKRLRSVITLTVAEALNPDLDLTTFALCVELLHNASLVIDDMPCMDNDNYRRGKETVHFKYGSCKAQALVSYFLKKAYEFLHHNYTELKESTDMIRDIDNVILNIYDILNKNMGFLGAATGQFIDICPMNAIIKEESYKKYYNSVESILDLIYLKTTTFFEIGFLPAYLLSLNRESTCEELNKVHKLVKYFGLAFQISDDFDDIEQDKKRVNSEYNPNIVCKYGLEEARSIYDGAINQFLNLSSELKINHVIFTELCDFLNNRVNSVMVK